MSPSFGAAWIFTLAIVGLTWAQAQPDKQTGHLKMALVNIKSLYSDGPDAKVNQANIEANLKRHFYFIDRFAGEGAEFVGFPELSVNGYHFSKTMTWLRLDGPEVKALQKKAIEKGIYTSGVGTKRTLLGIIGLVRIVCSTEYHLQLLYCDAACCT